MNGAVISLESDAKLQEKFQSHQERWQHAKENSLKPSPKSEKRRLINRRRFRGMRDPLHSWNDYTKFVNSSWCLFLSKITIGGTRWFIHPMSISESFVPTATSILKRSRCSSRTAADHLPLHCSRGCSASSWSPSIGDTVGSSAGSWKAARNGWPTWIPTIEIDCWRCDSSNYPALLQPLDAVEDQNEEDLSGDQSLQFPFIFVLSRSPSESFRLTILG